MNGVGATVRLLGLCPQAAQPSHGALGKLLDLSVPQFYHLKSGNNNIKPSIWNCCED